MDRIYSINSAIIILSAQRQSPQFPDIIDVERHFPIKIGPFERIIQRHKFRRKDVPVLSVEFQAALAVMTRDSITIDYERGYNS